MGLKTHTDKSIKTSHLSHDLETIAKEKISQCRHNPHLEIIINLNVKIHSQYILYNIPEKFQNSKELQMNMATMWWDPTPSVLCFASQGNVMLNI